LTVESLTACWVRFCIASWDENGWDWGSRTGNWRLMDVFWIMDAAMVTGAAEIDLSRAATARWQQRNSERFVKWLRLETANTLARPVVRSSGSS
jgi:hypothetical protein